MPPWIIVQSNICPYSVRQNFEPGVLSEERMYLLIIIIIIITKQNLMHSGEQFYNLTIR